MLVPATAVDINEHGLFIVTNLAVEVGELLEVTVQMPTGPLKACVIARYIGNSPSGRGIGAELFLLLASDRDRWVVHYRESLRALLTGPMPRDMRDFEPVAQRRARG